jgi:hypothetical protein
MAQAASDQSQAIGQAGMPVDAYGGPTVDPTKNVLDLVEAANKRQDDLRHMEAEHTREVIQIRTEAGAQRVESLDKIEGMRANHQYELRVAEADRINAIRAVDVGAVQQAATVSATTATTLAAQVATSAETLRTQVAAAASAQTIALAAALEPVQRDIQQLRQAQYEAAGSKAQTSESREKGANAGLWIGLALAATSVVFSGAFILVTLLATHVI